MVHLQEDGFIYRYGIGCFRCRSISSIVGRRGCSILSLSLPHTHTHTHTLLPTILLILMHLNTLNHTCIYDYLPED